jgi:hypothetical protein
MLEPIVGPRLGALIWAALLVGAIAIGVSGEVVITRNGTYALAAIAPGLALGAAARLAGCIQAARRDRASMHVGWRVASWVLLGTPAFLAGGFADPIVIALLALFYVLDLGGALLVRERDAPLHGAEAGRTRRTLAVVLFLVASLGSLVAFHVLWASQVDGGELLDWAFVAALAGLWLRFTLLPARRGSDLAALPPANVAKHAPRAQPIPNAAWDAWERAVSKVRGDGDLTDLRARVDEFGIDGLSSEMAALFERPGTTREEDLDAASRFLERRLLEAGMSAAGARPADAASVAEASRRTARRAGRGLPRAQAGGGESTGA